MGDREQVRRSETIRAGARNGADDLDKTVIGETVRSRRGYFLRALHVRFDNFGSRIRIELRQNNAFVRHLDITEELVLHLEPLISHVCDYVKNLRREQEIVEEGNEQARDR